MRDGPAEGNGVVERCERCGTDVTPEGRTVVLASDSRGDVREHVYCTSRCAMSPGSIAATTFAAIRRDRNRDGLADGTSPGLA